MKPTIAVIEDNPDNRLLVQAMLEDDYEIHEFENGPLALEAFQTFIPEVILLDISLPEMDGMEVLKHIRTMNQLQDCPVIAVTAHAMHGDREKFLSLGFTDYISKPILDDAFLIETIERLRKAV